MDKTETLEAIERLPLFELKTVQVDGIHQQKWVAIVEEGKTQAINIPTKRYVLVQLKEPLKQAIETLQAFNGTLYYFDGRCRLELIPEGIEYTDDKFQYGLSVFNSVTSETSIGIKLCVFYKGNALPLPSKMCKLTKTHSNKSALRITKEYLQLLTKVKENWSMMISHLPKIIVNDSELEDLKTLLSDESIERLKRIPNRNMWTVVMTRFNEISAGRNKSDIHKAEKYDDLSNFIWSSCITAGIIGKTL